MSKPASLRTLCWNCILLTGVEHPLPVTQPVCDCYVCQAPLGACGFVVRQKYASEALLKHMKAKL